MSRLTVRLPETLHHQLSNMAKIQGVSLNQYIVYALTRQVTLAYTARPIPETEIDQQKSDFNALLKSLGRASSNEIKSVLDERDTVSSERGLSPNSIKRLHERIKKKSKAASK